MGSFARVLENLFYPRKLFERSQELCVFLHVLVTVCLVLGEKPLLGRAAFFCADLEERGETQEARCLLGLREVPLG